MSTRRMMTVKQAAERLGLSEKTVYDLVNRVDGDGNPILPHYRPAGRCIRIGEHHLEAYLASSERKASGERVPAMRANRHPLADVHELVIPG